MDLLRADAGPRQHITCHVLDTMRGAPARSLPVTLFRSEEGSRYVLFCGRIPCMKHCAHPYRGSHLFMFSGVSVPDWMRHDAHVQIVPAYPSAMQAAGCRVEDTESGENKSGR